MNKDMLFSRPESSFSEELNSFTFHRDEVEIVSPKLPTKKELLVQNIEIGICKFKIITDVRNILYQYMQSGLRHISKGRYNQIISCGCNVLKDVYHSVIEHDLFLINQIYQQCNKDSKSKNLFIDSQVLRLTNCIIEQNPYVQNCPNRNHCARLCLTKQLQIYLNKFEGNLLVNPNSQKGIPNNKVGISSNDNSIKSFLSEKLVPIYGSEILRYESYKDFVNLIMNEYFSKDLAFTEIKHPIYPDFINVTKAKLYSKLLEMHKSDITKHNIFFNKEYPSAEHFTYFKELGERFDNDIYSDIDTYRNKKNIEILSNHSLQQNISKPIININRTGSNNKKNYIKIIRTLYTLTNGDISKVQQLAKLMAQIYLGENVCKHFNIRNNKVALLKTNNTKFLSQFFLGLFNFVLEDPIYGYETLRNTEIALASLLNDWMKIGGIQVRNQKLPYKQYRNKKSFYHISKHPITDLINNENVGKFIEEKLYGNIVNVAVESISDGTNLSNFEKLLTVDKNTVKRNQSLLGTQSITLNCKYVFITDDENSDQVLSNHDLIDYDFIRLSENIDEKERIFKDVLYYPIDENIVYRIFEEKEIHRDIIAFNQYEKYFMCVDFPLYGLELLINDTTPQAAEEEPALSIDSSETEFLEYFIKNCCETPDIDKFSYYNSNSLYWNIKEGTKLTHKPKCKDTEILDLKEGYMITAQLLKDAFEEFYKKVTNHKSTVVIDKNILPNYITVVKNQRVPDEVRILLENRGYKCTDKGTSCYLGIGLLSKKDILENAKTLKSKLHQKAPVKPTIDEFADFIFSKVATSKLLDSLKDADSKQK